MELNINEMEQKWIDYWDQLNVYGFKPAERDRVFAIDTPPPTVSGKMHMGHAFSYPHIDFIARYKRMRGYSVFFPWGFDDNGLPTERYVEKELNIRPDKDNISIFIEKCREVSEESEKTLLLGWKRLGMSCSFNDYYVTSSSETIKLSQAMFLDLVSKGRAYRDLAPAIRCPTCKTAISQIEMKDVTLRSTLVYINFKTDSGEITIATTRPELLGACVAIFVNGNDSRYSGIVGNYAYVPIYDRKVPILSDESIDMNFGTGAEMVCTFGDQNDLDLWRKYSLPLTIIIDHDGRMNEASGDLKGSTINEARKKIIEMLKNKGYLLKTEDIEHSVNTHERCGTPVEIFIEKQWFIRYLDLKEDFIKNGREIEWIPDYMRIRYENWVNGLKWDWCISRQRYYGVPFPVWYCKNCNETIYADMDSLPVDPRIDKNIIKCPKCGSSDIEPERDVMDTWATSSITPRLALQRKGLFPEYYPEDLRGQGHDIISFWAFTTIARSKIHDNKIPWNKIMISGNVYDMHGEKMSKSKGNIVDIYSVADKYGADALRYWSSSVLPGDDIKIKEQDFIRGKRTVIKLYNAQKLIDILKEDRKVHPVSKVKLAENLWILAKLSSIEKIVTDSMESYTVSKAKMALDDFFWNDFCDNYLEMIKYMVSVSKSNNDDDAIQETIYVASMALIDILKMYAPVMPFITEELYQKMDYPNKKASIHIDSWPSASESYGSTEDIDYIVSIISKVRMIKSERHISMGKPISSV
ncbi:MAG: valine--tRNA ligase, partial [Thermoplasmata archaeon]